MDSNNNNNDDYDLYKDYNGAAKGYSPYDLDITECYDEDDDPELYDCCDDAEDYGEEE